MTRITFTPIDSFIRDTASMIGDEEAKGYARLLRLTIAAMDEFNLFVTPNIRTDKFTVKANWTILMPNDTIRPVLVGKPGTNGYMFLLGQTDRLRYGEGNTECEDVTIYTYNNPDDPEIGYIISSHGEHYGRKEERFYGHWRYDADYNRILIESEGVSVEVGDTLVVSWLSTSDDFKLIPRDAAPMLRYKVLHNFYLSSDPGKAESFYRNFFRALKSFRKFRLDKFSYEDYLNAITREYNSAPK